MIKEVFQSKVSNQLEGIVREISKYFGEEYKDEIYERAGKTNVFLARGRGVVDVGKEERYIEREPICVKDDEYNYVVLPIDLLGEKTGNVKFLHVYLRAILEDVIKNDYSGLNDIVVDYIANDISKELANKKINVTLEKEPCYESESFYSKFYELIEEWYLNNKKEIFENVILNKENNIKDACEICEIVERSIDEFAYKSGEDVKEIKVKPRR